MSPQCKTIFDHLLRGYSISTLEAMRDFGCCRLSERIREIEATGIQIDRERVKIGRKHYTRYSYHSRRLTKINEDGSVEGYVYNDFGWPA